MNDEKTKKIVNIKIDPIFIEGELTIPQNPLGLVLFAHGSGSSRFSPRNNYVAQVLQKNNLATLLVDLLTKEEDMNYETRFDIDLLSKRLIYTTHWIKQNKETYNMKIGYFGASTGAAAAINAAAAENISAIVSRGGRVDLAEQNLSKIESPILLIVGGDDDFVLGVNNLAFEKIKCEKQLSIVPKATHLFEEPGTLEEVARLASLWFVKFFSNKDII